MKTTAWIATLIITAASATASAADAPDTTGTETAGSPSATTQPASAGLTREQVRAALFEARNKGEVPETEADMDVAQTRKHRPQGR